MTPKDKLTAALEALDRARRTLEELASIDTGDEEIDDAVSTAADTLEAEIAGAAHLQRQCV